jgi:hypothetical protein
MFEHAKGHNEPAYLPAGRRQQAGSWQDPPKVTEPKFSLNLPASLVYDLDRFSRTKLYDLRQGLE